MSTPNPTEVIAEVLSISAGSPTATAAHVVSRLSEHGYSIVPTEELDDIKVDREQALELAQKWSDASKAARKFEIHWPADCLMEAAGFIIGASTAAAAAEEGK